MIVEENDDKIILSTEAIGRITILKVSISNINVVAESDKVGDEYWFENPQETRYFWQPNGYGLKKGEGYYQNVWVLFNHVSYGVTDHFTLGGGMVPLFFFGGTPTPVWVTPKVSIPIIKDKLNMGAGAMLGYLIGDGGAAFGIPYAVITAGSRNSNLSFGAGWAFADGDFAESPTLSLSGMTRVSRKTYLMTESYYIDTGGSAVGFISLGGRTITKSVGIDYGLFFPISDDIGTFIAIPWLGVTVPFGNKPVYQ